MSAQGRAQLSQGGWSHVWCKLARPPCTVVSGRVVPSGCKLALPPCCREVEEACVRGACVRGSPCCRAQVPFESVLVVRGSPVYTPMSSENPSPPQPDPPCGRSREQTVPVMLKEFSTYSPLKFRDPADRRRKPQLNDPILVSTVVLRKPPPTLNTTASEPSKQQGDSQSDDDNSQVTHSQMATSSERDC